MTGMNCNFLLVQKWLMPVKGMVITFYLAQAVQGTEVDDMSGNYVEQETISTRGFLFR